MANSKFTCSITCLQKPRWLREPSVREVRFESKSTDQLNDELGDVDGNVQVGNLAEISPTVTEETFLKSYRLGSKTPHEKQRNALLRQPSNGNDHPSASS